MTAAVPTSIRLTPQALAYLDTLCELHQRSRSNYLERLLAQLKPPEGAGPQEAAARQAHKHLIAARNPDTTPSS